MKISSAGHTNRDTKHVAILVAVALLSPALMPRSAMPQAQAVDLKDEKTLKTGAAILGAVGAYYVAKGKTFKGVLAGAAGYYAYKKSKDSKNERNAGDVYPDNVYTSTRNEDIRSENNDDDGYVFPDEIEQGVTDNDVSNDDAYPAGRSVSRREERRVERDENWDENEDLGYENSDYLELNNKSAAPSKTQTEEAVLQ